MRRTLWVVIASAGLAVFVIAPANWPAGAATNQDSRPAVIKMDPRKFDDFVGQYSFTDDPDLMLSFFREGEKFFVQVSNQGRIEIFPTSESKFFLKVVDADTTFVRDS